MYANQVIGRCDCEKCMQTRVIGRFDWEMRSVCRLGYMQVWLGDNNSMCISDQRETF